MQNILNSWSNLKKIAEEKARIPIAYVIFVLLNVLIYSKKGMIISNIVTSNHTVKTVLELFFDLLSIIYNNIYIVFAVTISIFLLILFLFEKTAIFNILPDDTEYVNGMVESWNPVSAANRLFNLILNLSTRYFIYYIVLIFIINSEYISLKNNLVILGDPQKDYLLNILWSINYFILLYHIIRAAFVIKYKDDKRSLKLSNFRYNEISKFNVSSKYETIQYIIVKDTYDLKQYYLLEGRTHKQELKEFNSFSSKNKRENHTYWIKEEIPLTARSYQILDKSENLSDLVYYYNELKEKYKEIT